MPVVPKDQSSILGKSQDRPPPSGPPPAQPSPMYMLFAAAAMKDMGRLYKPLPVPIPAILSEARAEYWTQAQADVPDKVRSPATLVEEKGNIDLTKRPKVKNPDGSVSTERSMSFEEDGKEVLIPTVHPEGRIMSNKEAISHYKETGQHLGKFKNSKDADAYAEELHKSQAKRYGLD